LVYRAYDPKICRVVAIKLLRSDVLRSDDRDEYLKRFSQEARAAGSCRHPNIVVIHDFATHEEHPFLVMEYVDGVGLDQVLRRDGRLTPDDAVAVIVQVLDALDAAHSLGIVHRDVKPANILLLPNGQVKVTDFGIARLSGSDVPPDGTMLGTPAYMSPEQCRGESVDLRSDLFSAGSVLYELLSGAKPFPGDSYASIMQLLLTGSRWILNSLSPTCREGSSPQGAGEAARGTIFLGLGNGGSAARGNAPLVVRPRYRQ
jgi:eukaryotic-like serine/threonine-protein kinase